MRQALSRKATPEIPVPGDARGSPPSLQRAVPGGRVARRMGAAGGSGGPGPKGWSELVPDSTLRPAAAAPALRVAALAAPRTALVWERWSAAPRPLVYRDILFENVGPRFVAPRGWSGGGQGCGASAAE